MSSQATLATVLSAVLTGLTPALIAGGAVEAMSSAPAADAAKRAASVAALPQVLQGQLGAGMEARCGGWFVSWQEDAAGRPVPSSARLHCGGGAPVPLG
jgi:hypothetical protein